MEISWFGGTCVRLRGREGTVAADAFRSIVGPTGRGLTADISSYSHPDPEEGASAGRGRKAAVPSDGRVPRPSSLENAFYLDAPGEYEVHDVLIYGVRTYRDDARGRERGPNTAFVYELDGVQAVHLGDLGHVLTEDMLAEIGPVQVVCVPIGGALNATRAAEIVGQLDANLVVPMPVGGEEQPTAVLGRFLAEMGAPQSEPVTRLSVSISTVPNETTVVILDQRGRV
jgi:hypothetical protein